MGWLRIPVAILALLFAIFAPSWASAEKRVALVIGNSAYENVVALANPKNDSADMAAKLASLGFDVTAGSDLDFAAMRRMVRDFIKKLDGSHMAMMFYAGHGLQVNGVNYMMPVDAKLSSYDDLEFEAIPMDLILSAMERNAKVNLVFLDSCRDNPLAENLSRSMGTRSGSVGRGLAKIGSGVGSLIAFATQPGNVALDGAGRNSPFTSALLKHLGTPGQDLMRDLIHVRREVLEATQGKQVPWENSSLTGEIILLPKKEELKSEPQLVAKAPDKQDNSVELAYWDSIKASAEKSYFEAYLQQYPAGAFANLAKLKIAGLEKAIAKEQADAELKAKEDTKKAEQDRIVALKAETERLAKEKAATDLKAKELAEAERKAKADAQKEIEVTKLEEPADTALSRSIDPAELALETQKELARLGCLSGKIDGNWGATSEKALKEYSGRQGIKVASLEPSIEALDRLKATTVRVCPLVCGKGLEEKNGRCEKVRQEASVDTGAKKNDSSISNKQTSPISVSGSNERECMECWNEREWVKTCKRKNQSWTSVGLNTNSTNGCKKS